jgi:hypothetical protein
VLGARPPVARAEEDRRPARGVVGGAREAELDGLAAARGAAERGGHRRRVVDHEEVARAEPAPELAHRGVGDGAGARVEHHHPLGERVFARPGRGLHAPTASDEAVTRLPVSRRPSRRARTITAGDVVGAGERGPVGVGEGVGVHLRVHLAGVDGERRVTPAPRSSSAHTRARWSAAAFETP